MASTAPIESRYRWWRDPRWIFSMVVAAIAGIFLWGLFGPEPRLVVSRATTLITEPLRADGTPDYAAHVLELMGRGTPPEENAAVAVLQATWPMGLGPEDLRAVCKALGIPDTTPDTAPLGMAENDKELREELRELLGMNAPSGGIPTASPFDADARVDKLIDDARAFPWTSEDCPPLEAWIEAQTPALDLIVAGVNRPRYELPVPDLLRADQGTVLIGVAMEDLSILRNVSRGLTMRAMFHLGERRMPEAWRDLHAVHRLARLLAPAGSPRFLITHLLARAIEATANAATVTLLDSAHLTEAMAASIRRDLEALPPPADVGSSRKLERLGLLDVIVAIAHMRRTERANLWSSFGGDDMTWLVRTSLDMNIVLRTINGEHDRIDTALALPDHASRCRAVERINADLAAAPCGPGIWARAGWISQLAMNRQTRSTAFARNVMGSLASVHTGILGAYERAHANTALVCLAAALAEYRVRHIGGEGKPYPDSLQELVPEVVATVPNDPCSGKPFHYERRGDGYLLYSVGPDGVDDGGTNDELEQGEWRASDDYGGDDAYKDMAIRLPRPKRTIVPPVNTGSE